MGSNFEYVEVDGLGQRSALSDDGDIADLDGEGRGTVGSEVSVSLLVSVIFGDVVEIVSSDDNGAVHFGGNDDALEDLTPDGDVAGEGAFLINVDAFDGFLGSLEVESDVLVVPGA